MEELGENASGLLVRRTGGINSFDEFKTMSRQRKNLTRIRGDSSKLFTQHGRDLDFLDLVSLVCDIYQNHTGDLIPMQQFHRSYEVEEDAGNACIVTSRNISSPTPSTTIRGETIVADRKVIIKRTKTGILETQNPAIRNLITELRIRSHPPLQDHPNIVDLRGIAWDFENDDEEKPRPLLIEEFAPHRSLATFWETQNLVRMPFRVKAQLCKDIASGINALHLCGIVHGDVKPDNILIFNQQSKSSPFQAKLTDFGHSICRFEARGSLPAWTPWWCAPEADAEISDSISMTFENMMATDVYSYGLVATSIVIGISIFSERFLEFRDKVTVSTMKTQDGMVDQAMKAVAREDRTQLDSDFDLAVVRALLDSCLRASPELRSSISDCVKLLQSYEESLYNSPTRPFEMSFQPKIIKPLPLTQPPTIGYRSLTKSSFLVKRKIANELEKVASENSDARSAACAWELCVCYFSGFGVERNWQRSRYWITKAAMAGLTTAQAFYIRIHNAMSASPFETLSSSLEPSSNGATMEANATSILSEWLGYAVSQGCLEVLPDLMQFERDSGLEIRSEYITKFRNSMATKIRTVYDSPDSPRGPGSRDFTSNAALQLLKGSALGNLDIVRAAFISDPEALIQVDAEGNSALILAAKFGNFEILKFLLQHTKANAGIYNKAQQNVLHYLDLFNADQLKHLILRLVENGADISREGLPVVYATETCFFTLSIRCCPLLNAIVRGNLTLLELLLEASHQAVTEFPCTICEAGSRYRKIVAVAFALHNYKVINMLQDHFDHFNIDQGRDLEKIEIWHNDSLIPLRQVVFDGFSLSGMDLPEPFLRAIYHQDGHQDALHRTLDYLLPGDPERVDKRIAYQIIMDSVDHDASDALGYLLSRWFTTKDLLAFALGTIGDFYNNPVFASIRFGFRRVFMELAGKNGEHIADVQTKILCPNSCCRGRHRLNTVQLCLSSAVTAVHCDTFFVEFIVKNCPESRILASPTIIDEELTGQPPAFMAQAILSCAFPSAAMIAKQLPVSMMQMVPQIPVARRLKQSQSYNAVYNGTVLQSEGIICLRYLELSHFVFLTGSNAMCQFIQSWRIQTRHQTDEFASNTELAVSLEAGQVGSRLNRDEWNWRDYPLSTKELHWLLFGLIADNKRDRSALWELFKHQIHLKQHARFTTSTYYLRLAVMYNNYEALGRIYDTAWGANGINLSRLKKLSVLNLALLVEWTGRSFPVHGTQWRLILPTQKFSAADRTSAQQVVALLRTRGFKPLATGPFPSLLVVSAVCILVVNFLVIPLPLAFFGVKANYSPANDYLDPYLWSLSTTLNLVLIMPTFGPLLALRLPWACYNLKTYPFELLACGIFWVSSAILFLGFEYVVLIYLYVCIPESIFVRRILNFGPIILLVYIAAVTAINYRVEFLKGVMIRYKQYYIR